MNKKLAFIVLAICAIVGSYFGYVSYDKHKFVKSITPNVKNTSIRLANAIRIETEEGSKITFKELFDKLESDINEIDKHILEIQTLATPSNKAVTEPVLTYLKSSQELLRSLLAMNRKILAYSSARDRSFSAIADYKAGSYFMDETLYRMAKNAIIESTKAMKERDEALADVVKATKIMKDSRFKVASIMSSDALSDPAIFDAVIKKFEPLQSGPTQSGPAQSGPAMKAQEIPAGTGKIASVIQTMNSGGYTYVEAANENGSKVWLALPEVKVAKGDKIEYPETPPLLNFQSKTLNKTFDKISFVPGLRIIK